MSIIFQNFWSLFLELFCAKAALNVQYLCSYNALCIYWPPYSYIEYG